MANVPQNNHEWFQDYINRRVRNKENQESLETLNDVLTQGGRYEMPKTDSLQALLKTLNTNSTEISKLIQQQADKKGRIDVTHLFKGQKENAEKVKDYLESIKYGLRQQDDTTKSIDKTINEIQKQLAEDLKNKRLVRLRDKLKNKRQKPLDQIIKAAIIESQLRLTKDALKEKKKEQQNQDNKQSQNNQQDARELLKQIYGDLQDISLGIKNDYVNTFKDNLNFLKQLGSGQLMLNPTIVNDSKDVLKQISNDFTGTIKDNIKFIKELFGVKSRNDNQNNESQPQPQPSSGNLREKAVENSEGVIEIHLVDEFGNTVQNLSSGLLDFRDSLQNQDRGVTDQLVGVKELLNAQSQEEHDRFIDERERHFSNRNYLNYQVNRLLKALGKVGSGGGEEGIGLLDSIEGLANIKDLLGKKGLKNLGKLLGGLKNVAGSALRIGGKALPFVSAAVASWETKDDIAYALSGDENAVDPSGLERSKGEAAIDSVGKVGGTAIGSVLGGVIGSIGGPAGTVIGAYLGGQLLGNIGENLRENVSGFLGIKTNKEEKRKQQQQAQLTGYGLNQSVEDSRTPTNINEVYNQTDRGPHDVAELPERYSDNWFNEQREENLNKLFNQQSETQQVLFESNKKVAASYQRNIVPNLQRASTTIESGGKSIEAGGKVIEKSLGEKLLEWGKKALTALNPVAGLVSSTIDYFTGSNNSPSALSGVQTGVDLGTGAMDTIQSGVNLTPTLPANPTPDDYRVAFLQKLNKEGITDPKVQAILMGQIEAETKFRPQEANFNYSAEAIKRYHPKLSQEQINALARNPEAYKRYVMLNVVGDKTADYYGRGLIQLTGKKMYEIVGNAMGQDLVSDPNKAMNPSLQADIAFHFMKEKGIIEQARQGNIAEVTRRVLGKSSNKDVKYRTQMAHESLKRITALQQQAQSSQGNIQNVSYTQSMAQQPVVPMQGMAPQKGMVFQSNAVDPMTVDWKKYFSGNIQDLKYMNPEVAASLINSVIQFWKETGTNKPVPLNSSYRNYAEQKQLKKKYGKKAADPGYSSHNTAGAVDISQNAYGSQYTKWMRAGNAQKFNLQTHYSKDKEFHHIGAATFKEGEGPQKYWSTKELRHRIAQKKEYSKLDFDHTLFNFMGIERFYNARTQRPVLIEEIQQLASLPKSQRNAALQRFIAKANSERIGTTSYNNNITTTDIQSSNVPVYNNQQVMTEPNVSNMPVIGFVPQTNNNLPTARQPNQQEIISLQKPNATNTEIKPVDVIVEKPEENGAVDYESIRITANRVEILSTEPIPIIPEVEQIVSPSKTEQEKSSKKETQQSKENKNERGAGVRMINSVQSDVLPSLHNIPFIIPRSGIIMINYDIV